MRKQKLVGSILTVFGMAGLLIPARAQVADQARAPFTIRRPKDGAVVREKVRVEIPKAGVPDGSFVLFTVDGQFRVATVPPKNSQVLSFVWDTKIPEDDLKLAQAMPDKYTENGYPKEGPHTIEATLYDAGGQKRAESSVNVILRNSLASPPRSPVRLAYRFRIDELLRYSYRLEGDLKTQDNEPFGQYSQIVVTADWEQTTLDILGGWATISEKFAPYCEAMIFSPTPTPMSIAGQRVFANMTTSGRMQLSSRTAKRGLFAVYYPIDLKPGPVRVGDKWNGVVKLMTDPDTGEALPFPAQHTLVGFEWQYGVECARIQSTFHGKQKILRRMAAQSDTTVDVEGERTTYFAYKLGRIIKSVDIIRGTASLPAVILGGGAPGGMGPGGGMPGGMMGPGGGMPGGMMGPGGGMPGGMMGPGGGMPGGMMGPGGGMPGGMMGPGGGMPGGMMGPGGGMPGMGPGGRPGIGPGGGMPGAGAGAIVPPPAGEPVKIKFDLTATVEIK